MAKKPYNELEKLQKRFDADQKRANFDFQIDEAQAGFDSKLEIQKAGQELKLNKAKAGHALELENHIEYLRKGGGWGRAGRVATAPLKFGKRFLIERPNAAIGGAAKKLGIAALAVGGVVAAAKFFGGKPKTVENAILEAHEEMAAEQQMPMGGDGAALMASGMGQGAYPGQVNEGSPQPIGIGANGRPYYGPHSAQATGMGGENKTIPPRMTAANFQPAEEAVKTQVSGLSPA